MSLRPPDDESAVVYAPGLTHRYLRHDAPTRFLRRWATRIAWYEHPVVHLRYVVADDALLVDILPLAPVCDRVVDDLLCIEFDGTDSEMFPTSLCLTGLTSQPHSPAAQVARHLLGETLCRTAEEMVRVGDAEREVVLDKSVRDSRVRAWRRLTGLAIGVEIVAGALRAVLVGADGEVVEREQRLQPDMSPDAVTVGIAALAHDMRVQHRATIADTPVYLGVQIGGPVDAQTGVVHAFRTRGADGRRGCTWHDVPLTDMLELATGLRSYVCNDVVGYAAYDRWFYPDPDERCRAVLLIADRIGAKLLINGDVATHMPMEIGNLTMHEDGAPCECGRRGCLEATSGTRAIVERVTEVAGQPVCDIEDAVALAEPQQAVDDRVTEVFRNAGRDLARGIATVQTIANPSSWSIYGPACLLVKSSRAGDAFVTSLSDFEQWVAYDAYQDSSIRRHPIESDEGVHGAALVALEHFGVTGPHSSTDDGRPW